MAPKSFSEVASGYANLWAKAEIRPERRAEAEKAADRILAVYDRYTPVTEKTGVPEWVIGIIHWRESTLNFKTHLVNGQPLNQVTTLVPKGIGPFLGDDAFERGAIIGLESHDLNKIKDWSAARFLYQMEKWNGWGYWGKINSPYNWAATTLQERGKYVSDGNYDPNHWDTQLGAAAILKALCEKSNVIDAQVNGPDEPAPQPEPQPEPVPIPEPIPVPPVSGDVDWNRLHAMDWKKYQAHLDTALSELTSARNMIMDLKTAADVHKAIQRGVPASEIVKERKMGNEIPETAIVDVVPWYRKRTVLLAIVSAVSSAVALFSKNAIVVDAATQAWIVDIAITLAGITGATAVGTAVRSSTVTPTGKAKANS